MQAEPNHAPASPRTQRGSGIPEHEDGTPADPPKLHAAGASIVLGSSSRAIRTPFRHVRLVPLAEDLFDQAPLVKPRSLDIIAPTRTR
jgi:hypothetical protein